MLFKKLKFYIGGFLIGYNEISATAVKDEILVKWCTEYRKTYGERCFGKLSDPWVAKWLFDLESIDYDKLARYYTISLLDGEQWNFECEFINAKKLTRIEVGGSNAYPEVFLQLLNLISRLETGIITEDDVRKRTVRLSSSAYSEYEWDAKGKAVSEIMLEDMLEEDQNDRTDCIYDLYPKHK